MSYKEVYPSKLLEEAVDAISTLPGVGRRSALRLALHLLKQPAENVRHFTASIDRLRNEVKYCRQCMMISDDDVCSICSDRSRDHRTICVVETVRDVMSIENTGQYHGVYHVLGGIISPINGVGPSDLTIRELISRVAALSEGTDATSEHAPEVILRPSRGTSYVPIMSEGFDFSLRNRRAYKYANMQIYPFFCETAKFI